MRSIVAAAVANMAIGGLLISSGCTKQERPVDQGVRTRTLLVGNQNEPATLDPHLMNSLSDARIGTALFEGLTVLDEKSSQPMPGTAERWEISADGMRYTFHLRADARWSNGERVTAADFAYSFRRMLTPALGATYAYMLWPIKNAEAFNSGKLTDLNSVGIEVIDDLTLQLTLERPTPYLLALVAHSTWFPVPRGTVEKFGRMEARDTPWTRPGNLVGNGAFVLTEWRPNARIVLTKNAQYWNSVHNQIERVMFFPIEKADAEEVTFRAGQLHLTANLPTSKVESYRRQNPGQLRLDPVLSTIYLNFNVTKPPLNNPKLRRALAMAVDRSVISTRVYQSMQQPARTFTPPGCGGYEVPAGQRDDFAAARALLAEAGYPDGRGLVSMSLQVLNDEKFSKLGEAIQGMWQRELGVRITVEPYEQKTWLQNQETLSHTLGLMFWIADYPDPLTFLDVFRGTGGNNYTGWTNPDYVRLLQQAGSTAEPQARFALLQRAESILLSEAPIAPIVFDVRAFAVHPAVQNLQPSPLGINRYHVLQLKN